MNTQCDRLIVRNITVGFFLLDIVYNLRTVKPLDSQKAGNNTFFTQVLERLSETKLKPKHDFGPSRQLYWQDWSEQKKGKA